MIEGYRRLDDDHQDETEDAGEKAADDDELGEVDQGERSTQGTLQVNLLGRKAFTLVFTAHTGSWFLAFWLLSALQKAKKNPDLSELVIFTQADQLQLSEHFINKYFPPQSHSSIESAAC